MAKKTTLAAEQQVSDALDGLRDKRAAIEERRKTKTQWTSSCRLELPGWPTITIQIERDTALLVLAIGTLRRFGEDLTTYSVPASWDGFTIADWIADLEKRVHWLLDEEVLTKVASFERKIKPLMTEGQRREKEMEALAGDLSDLLD